MTTGQLLFLDDAAAAEHEIQALGGRVTHRFSDTAVVAALPIGVDATSIGAASTDAPTDIDITTGILTRAWRDRAAASPSADALATRGLSWDTTGYDPPLEGDPDSLDDRSGGRPPNSDRTGPLSTGTPTSRYMIGSIAVGVVVVSGPTDELRFANAEKAKLMSEVQEGLDFLANAEPRAAISFVYDVHFEDVDVEPGPTTTYESAERPWRDAALANMGFPPGRGGSLKYVQDLRAGNGTDWAYAVYFTKYPLKHFAYAGAERTTMHWDNDGWGVDSISRVFAHETCHIFGAADEYGSCTCGSVHGHLGVPNGNCRDCPGDRDPCLMEGNVLELCDFTRRQLGWEESMFPGGTTRLHGPHTLIQKSSSRYLDAYETTDAGFNVITRNARGRDTQGWILSQVGQVCTIRQRSTRRYMDAHENNARDHSVVTRTEQANDTQRWVMLSTPDALSTYTVQQLRNGRHLDAHTTTADDFNVVTRSAQHNDTQRWVFTPPSPGAVSAGAIGADDYTIRHVVNGRYLDAHRDSGHDFSVVTRPWRDDDSQLWTVLPVAGVYTLQQRSNGRLLDAFHSTDRDHSAMTRVTQQNDTQRWVLTPLGDRTYTLQQLSSGRYLDAHESSGQDHSVITRTLQNNDTQRWIIHPV